MLLLFQSDNKIFTLLPGRFFSKEIISQMIYFSKNRKPKQVVTYTGEIMKYVWLVFFVVIVLMLVIVNWHEHVPHQTDSIILVLYVMPTFLIGKILRFKPLIIGALSCWVLAVSSLFIPYQYHILLVAVGVIMGWIIPGYFLNNRYKKQL